MYHMSQFEDRTKHHNKQSLGYYNRTRFAGLMAVYIGMLLEW